MTPGEADRLFQDRLPVTGYEAVRNEDGRIVGSLNERRRIALAEIDGAAFSRFHVKVALVTGVGFFTDAYDIFAIGIAATMIGIVYGTVQDRKTGLMGLTQWQSACLKLATPVGNLIGQLLFGFLADILGRKRMYGVELMIMIVATFSQAVSGQGPVLSIVGILVFWRFILGVGIGGDYPLSVIIASEFASTRTRGRLMTAVFSFQGWGQLAASLVGLSVVSAFKHDINRSPELVDYTWRLLLGLGCVPAMIALYFRLTIPETPRFTMDVDRKVNRATRDIKNALANTAYNIYADDDVVEEQRVAVPPASGNDFVVHFSKSENLKVLFGTAYSWFALDIAFYTLTLDSSNLIPSTSSDYSSNPAYTRLVQLCLGNIILTLAGFLPGFAASFLFIDVWGRKPIQIMGFVVLTVIFWIMGFANLSDASFTALYCLANFFQNFGPNTTTFIVPGEVFPTRYRSTAHGISAASGKLGAVIAQLVCASVCEPEPVCTPHQLQRILKILSFFMMTGIFSTLLIPETMLRTLEDLSNEEQGTYITGTSLSSETREPTSSSRSV